MKILLTGKNGQVGFELRRSLSLLGQVYAVDIRECDLSNVSSLRKLLRDVNPDVIVNPAAYTAVDKAESDQELARTINAHAPAVIAEEARKTNALLIHFSTDYVFDGTKQSNYLENDLPNPQSVYGLTKLEGELAVQSLCTKYVVLRTSWVVGAHGGNFAKTMLRLAQERDTLNVVADQFGTPTSAAMLADITAHVLKQYISSAQNGFSYGLYHTTASGHTNWHEYACHVIAHARAAGLQIRVPQQSIQPIQISQYPTPAKRPSNSRLDTTHLCSTFGLELPDWRVGVEHILEQIHDNAGYRK